VGPAHNQGHFWILIVTAFSDAISDGLAEVAEAAGEEVTYVQGVTSLTVEGAVQGQTTWDADKPQPGLKITERTVSWLVELAELVDSGTQLYPAKGDTLTTSDGRNFRALPIGPSSPVYEFVDRNGRTWVRISMKER
jgi:hypothetical protein